MLKKILAKIRREKVVAFGVAVLIYFNATNVAEVEQATETLTTVLASLAAILGTIYTRARSAPVIPSEMLDRVKPTLPKGYSYDDGTG